MNNLRQAAQQALEALEYEARTGNDDAYRAEREALCAALAEPEQPVEYVRDEDNPCYMFTAPTPQPEQEPQTTHWEGCEAVHPECRAIPRRPLTHEEIEALDNLPVCPSDAEVITFVRKIERAHGIGAKE